MADDRLKARLHVATCAFVTTFALVYAAVDYLRLPRLFYFPHERVFRMARAAEGVEMGYVGLWLWSLLAGLTIGGAVLVLSRAQKWSPSKRLLDLSSAWSLTALLLSGAYFTWQNWP